MTEPTDAELAALAVEINRTDWDDAMDALICFARAVLARWGQPAHSGEPVGYLYCGGSYGDELAEWEIVANQLQCDRLNEHHGALGKEARLPIYTAPQPVEREPLTDEQSHALLHRMADECDKWADGLSYEPTREQASGWCVAFLMRELPAHGIKGGQHGTDQTRA